MRQAAPEDRSSTRQGPLGAGSAFAALRSPRISTVARCLLARDPRNAGECGGILCGFYVSEKKERIHLAGMLSHGSEIIGDTAEYLETARCQSPRSTRPS